ncbi:MAG TPA: hypothetical protein VLT33_15535 [Labilithrix sp.]|nr:hypothetical protein [Labilithrix sp.]
MRCAALAALLALAVMPREARADAPPATGKDKDDPPAIAPAGRPSRSAADAALARIIDRPHTIAELEAGVIALPNAPISAGQSGGDTPFGTIGRGDATMQIGLHVLYRWNRTFAVGAGVLFSPLPTSDTEYGGLRALPRTHARSYFFMGAEGRYIPLHYKFLEAWVGLSVGGVVIADRFTTNAGDEVAPIIGTKEITVRTEGFAFGLQFGGTYFLSENWIAGANFRAYRWILPEAQRCSSIGDCATLSGTVEALELGITIGYRLPL